MLTLRIPGPVRTLVPALALALLPACGNDDEGTPAPSLPQSVSGRVTKGPVAGASVSIHAIGAGGAPGSVVAGPFTTDASGGWSGEIPAGASGPYLLVAGGGTYTDEASGAVVDLGAAELRGYGPSGSGQVTPYTHALAAAAARLIDDGGQTPAAAWTSVITTFDNAFGLDPTTTAPSLTGNTEQRTYLALLGGVSELLDENPALDALAGAAPIDLVLALAADLSDGVLDGLEAGVPINVDTRRGSVAWPPLDAAGIGALIDAINAYAAGIAELQDIVLGKIDLDFGDPTGGTGSGSVTFSGPGAALIPVNPFTPLGFSANQLALAWSGGGVGGTVTIGVSKAFNDPTRASLVTVAAAQGSIGYGWSVSVFEPGAFVPGVAIEGNTVTFTNTMMAGVSNTDQPITLNGTLGP